MTKPFLAVLALAVVGWCGYAMNQADTESAAPVAMSTGASLPLSRAAIAALFPDVSLRSSPLKDGRERVMGTSADKLIMLEIVGPAQAPSSAIVISGLVEGRTTTAVTAMTNGLKLIRAVMPGDSVCSKWFVQAIARASEQQNQETRCQRFAVHMRVLPGMLSLSVVGQ